jgi:hypothetical protein
MCGGEVRVQRCAMANAEHVSEGGARTNVLESLEHVVDEAVGHARLGVLSSLHAGDDGKK